MSKFDDLLQSIAEKPFKLPTIEEMMADGRTREQAQEVLDAYEAARPNLEGDGSVNHELELRLLRALDAPTK